MPNPVKNLVQGKDSTLLLTHSPATGLSKAQVQRDNLVRLRYFQPSDYSFESFVEMCDIFQPKWLKIVSKGSGIAIQYAQTSGKAFFAKGETFAQAYQHLMEQIRQYQPKVAYTDIA